MESICVHHNIIHSNIELIASLIMTTLSGGLWYSENTTDRMLIVLKRDSENKIRVVGSHVNNMKSCVDHLDIYYQGVCNMYILSCYSFIFQLYHIISEFLFFGIELSV